MREKRRRRDNLHASERRLAYMLLLPGAILLLLLAVIPFGKILLLSTQEVDTGENSGSFVGLANYSGVLSDGQFYSGLIHTLIWTGGSLVGEMLLGLGVALLLHQQFRMRGIARALVLFPYLIPTIVAVLIWRYMFNDLVGIVNHLFMAIGLIDQPILWLSNEKLAMFSVILVGVWKFFPFVVIALLGILQSIPQEQYEAAQMDGASEWRQFWHITWPSILPVFMITALLRAIWNFDKFDIIYLLTGGGPLNATTTLPLLVYFKAFSDYQMGKASAVAVLSFLFLSIILVVYLKVQKKVEDRIT